MRTLLTLTSTLSQSFLFAIARPPNGLSWGVVGDTGDQVLSTGPILVMMARQIPHAAMRGDNDFVCAFSRVLSVPLQAQYADLNPNSGHAQSSIRLRRSR